MSNPSEPWLGRKKFGIETIEIKRTGPILNFREYRCQPCLVIWTVPGTELSSKCPECDTEYHAVNC